MIRDNCRTLTTNRHNSNWKSKMFAEKNTLCFEDNLHFEWNMCNLEDTWNTNTACDLKWGQHQLCYKILSWVTRVTFSEKLHEGS